KPHLLRCGKREGFFDFKEGYIKWFLEKNFEKPKNSEKTFGDPVGTWVYNSEKLAQEYKNDPRNLKVDTLEKTLKNMRGFKGFGKETPWLLIKNYTKAGIWQFPLEQLNIKIDRHVIRISYGTRVVVLPQEVKEIRYDAIVPPLSEVYGRVISEKIVSPIQLNDAFWAIGQYRCKENNAVYCDTDCPMKCKTKPQTDKQFTTLDLSQDTRKDFRNLFSDRN
ncbi:MAG: hypothetical protein Q8N55_04185, partial [bacterium]|nr:hypothetical protein [bacterium]